MDVGDYDIPLKIDGQPLLSGLSSTRAWPASGLTRSPDGSGVTRADTIEWGETSLSCLSEAWQALDTSQPSPALFLSPAYQSVLRQLPARATEYGAIVARGGGSIEALMPIMKRTRLIGPSLSTQFLIHPDDMSLVRTPGRYRLLPVRQISPVIRLRGLDARGGWISTNDLAHDEALARIMSALALDLSWDIGLFPVPQSDLVAWSHMAAKAGLSYLERHYNRRFHMLTKTAPVEDLLRRTSSNFRKTLRQARRRAKAADVVITVNTGRMAVEKALPALDASARESWKSAESDPDIPLFLPWDDQLRRFVSELLDLDERRLSPVLLTARTPQGATATQLWLRSGNRLMALLTYFDRALQSLSPGKLMLVAGLDWAFTNGVTEVDFNATSPWVAPFSDLIEPYVLVTLGSRSTWGRSICKVARFVDWAQKNS